MKMYLYLKYIYGGFRVNVNVHNTHMPLNVLKIQSICSFYRCNTQECTADFERTSKTRWARVTADKSVRKEFQQQF